MSIDPNAQTTPNEAPPWRMAYPWGKWFDGKTHVLRQGIHFPTSLESMRCTIYVQAKRWGVRVRVSCDRDAGAIWLQASGEPRPPKRRQRKPATTGPKMRRDNRPKPDPTPEEIRQRAAEIRRKNLEAMRK